MKTLVTCLALFPGAALAGFEVSTVGYSCDRGAMVTATYINDADQSAAIVQVEGQTVTLWIEEAASGARYGWPSDGSHYVWWTKGDEGTLYWNDGERATESPLLANCKAVSGE